MRVLLLLVLLGIARPLEQASTLRAIAVALPGILCAAVPHQARRPGEAAHFGDQAYASARTVRPQPPHRDLAMPDGVDKQRV